ncbi:uncharacterized protein P884DRAFT_175821, partial [Thermothelomyces heterothallicus CBS 202.75]|uniref:uncharacterized protein n=1 Tax=Thermothelomyces heterothallicus CBS 202.75 TaxID=1149848 RepID=UPI0037426A53
MMPSLVGANMLGMPHQQTAGGTYTVDAFLNQLSRQLIGNTRRYSRGANGQQRGGNGMRISKPGSASNSPRSSTMQARRRTLIGDGFRGGLQTMSPAMEQIRLPTPAAETPNEHFYERQTTRPARPVSWHPSSQNDAQQPLYALPDAAAYPYAAYNDAEILASLQQFPPTPAIYSGYASPAEPFSPLSLPYSSFSSSQQPVYSPVSQPLQMPHQQQAPPFSPVTCSSDYPAAAALSDIPYLPLPQAAADVPAWEQAQPAIAATFSQQTAPPTPEDFACSLGPSLAVETAAGQQQPTKPDATAEQTCQPVIYEEDDDDEPEGEILYGMGLYDAPDHSKVPTLHQSVVLSLLGSTRDREEDVDTGKGLGLKLEDPWEPPASDDEDEGEGEGEGESEGEGEGE